MEWGLTAISSGSTFRISKTTSSNALSSLLSID